MGEFYELCRGLKVGFSGAYKHKSILCLTYTEILLVWVLNNYLYNS